jgi:hypothetical protein
LRILRANRHGKRHAEHGTKSNNRESQPHGHQVYSSAARQQAPIVFKIARAMRRNWAGGAMRVNRGDRLWVEVRD